MKVLNLLSGFMAFCMLTTPLTASADVVNSRYFGTYQNYLPANGKIIIDSNGCKLENFNHNKPINSSYPYVTTSYTQVYSINISKFTADYTSTQYYYLNANGVKKNPAKDDPLVVTGDVDERDEDYAPLRRYITINVKNSKFTYWKDL